MAILKSVMTPHGVIAQYHKIVKVEISAASKTVELMVAIYATTTARENNAPPLWHEYIRIPFDNFSQDPRDMFYPLLASFGDSYLRDGTNDASSDGECALALKPEAMLPTIDQTAQAGGQQ